jgi:basic membrane lipoprotein Med (substrate-binding protein (PBP1-ABC) superfamily)
MVWDLYPLLSLMVDEIESGAFRPGKYYSLGVADGSLAAQVNPQLEDRIPEEVQEKAQSVVDSIVNGTFEVPYVPEAQE